MRDLLTSQKFCSMNLEANVPERRPHFQFVCTIILLRCVLFIIYFVISLLVFFIILCWYSHLTSLILKTPWLTVHPLTLVRFYHFVVYTTY